MAKKKETLGVPAPREDTLPEQRANDLRGQIVCAFPGTGKTSLTKHQTCIGKFIDLDFGHLRKAMRGMLTPYELLSAYGDLIKIYSDDGYNVLINEPDVLFSFEPRHEVDIIMVLPGSERTIKRSAHKLGVNYPTAEQWVKDWAAIASNWNSKHGYSTCHMPVVYLREDDTLSELYQLTFVKVNGRATLPVDRVADEYEEVSVPFEAQYRARADESEGEEEQDW